VSDDNQGHGSEIDRLIRLLAKLPGLGPRSARRAVLQLIKRKESLMLPLANALLSTAEHVRACSICGNLDTIDPCKICDSPRRDRSIICVVEEVGDLWALERSGTYHGLYHVLGGTLSALDGIGPDDLTIAGLIKRAGNEAVREVIIATNATVDGQTTAHYITDRLAGGHVTVTHLAHGVPVGGELDYLDDGTLMAALKARRPY
jgi:recombination protein RecR